MAWRPGEPLGAKVETARCAVCGAQTLCAFGHGRAALPEDCREPACHEAWTATRERRLVQPIASALPAACTAVSV